MSDPYLIWTMRRTGGTSLATLLSRLSEHPAAQHEPFNLDRAHGQIHRDFRRTGDTRAMEVALRRVLERRPVIKHCYELVPEPLNLALIRAAADVGYRHIVLDRQAEADRIVSLELAKATGAWGPDEARTAYAEIAAGRRTLPPIDIAGALSQLRTCARLRAWLALQFDLAGLEPLLVYFEEIYAEFAAGRATVERILQILGIDPAGDPDFEAALSTALTQSSQGSQSMAEAVPNIITLRARLEEVQAAEGFRFETATRSSPPTVHKGAPASSGLILDVKAAPGDDTDFYLAKGFAVIALEDDPLELHRLRARFPCALADGRLTLLPATLDPGDGASPALAEVLEGRGPARYAKIETGGAGGEKALVAGLRALPCERLPRFLSVQLNADWDEILSTLVQLGYDAFQLVRQGPAHLPAQPDPPKEGRYAPLAFTATMSGPFGEDLPRDGWQDADGAREVVRLVQAEKAALRRAGGKPGWHDLHCRRPGP